MEGGECVCKNVLYKNIQVMVIYIHQLLKLSEAKD